jgi:cytochrome b
MPNQADNSTDRPPITRVIVWDMPVRLFHWSLVAMMFALVITGKILDGAMEQHALIGKAVIVLVLFRIMWGIVGSSYARFSQFVRSPKIVLAYARSLFSNKYEFNIGHNPLGGWMVLVLLVAVLSQAILGLFSNDDILFDGPLAYLISKDTSDLITGLHSDLFYLLLVLVALHVSAVVWHKLIKGENLLLPMFTGYKEMPSSTEAQNASGGGVLLAIILFIVSAGIVYWLTV